MDSYLARVKELVINLKHAGHVVDRRTLIFKLLAGLDGKFESARASLQASLDYNKMSFDHVTTYLLGQATLFAMRNKSHPPSKNAQAHAASTNAAQSRGPT